MSIPRLCCAALPVGLGVLTSTCPGQCLSITFTQPSSSQARIEVVAPDTMASTYVLYGCPLDDPDCSSPLAVEISNSDFVFEIPLELYETGVFRVERVAPDGTPCVSEAIEHQTAWIFDPQRLFQPLSQRPAEATGDLYLAPIVLDFEMYDGQHIPNAASADHGGLLTTLGALNDVIDHETLGAYRFVGLDGGEPTLYPVTVSIDTMADCPASGSARIDAVADAFNTQYPALDFYDDFHHRLVFIDTDGLQSYQAANGSPCVFPQNTYGYSGDPQFFRSAAAVLPLFPEAMPVLVHEIGHSFLQNRFGPGADGRHFYGLAHASSIRDSASCATCRNFNQTGDTTAGSSCLVGYGELGVFMGNHANTAIDYATLQFNVVEKIFTGGIPESRVLGLTADTAPPVVATQLVPNDLGHPFVDAPEPFAVTYHMESAQPGGESENKGGYVLGHRATPIADHHDGPGQDAFVDLYVYHATVGGGLPAGELGGAPLRFGNAQWRKLYIRSLGAGESYVDTATTAGPSGTGVQFYACVEGEGRIVVTSADDPNPQAHCASIDLPPFVRGDANGDQLVKLDDAIAMLTYLFANGPAEQLDAMDVNDNGSVALNDVILLFDYLFNAGAPPAAPFPMAGVDPTPDGI